MSNTEHFRFTWSGAPRRAMSFRELVAYGRSDGVHKVVESVVVAG
jgi:hypothetical protein